MATVVPPTPPPIEGYYKFLERKYIEGTNSKSVKNKWQPQEFDLWDLRLRIETIGQWLIKAKEEGVDVSLQNRHMVQSIVEAPRLKNLGSGKINQVAVNQLVFVLSLYCNQVIRKVALTKIRRLAREGENRPELQDRRGLIGMCEMWAISRLPPERTLGSPEKTFFACQAVLEKVDEMREKILKKASRS